MDLLQLEHFLAIGEEGTFTRAAERVGRQEIAAGPLVRVKLAELNIPRQTFMIYRDQGRHSDAARELITVVRSFNWESASGARVRPIRKRA